MDLNEIKEIMDSEGGKFIIIENGRPVMVILSFDDYKSKMRAQKTLTPKETNPKAEPQKPLPKELEDEELKIEDLPF